MKRKKWGIPLGMTVPIALIFASVAFDQLSLRKQSLALLRAAYYTVIVAAISSVPTIATGLLAWQL